MHRFLDFSTNLNHLQVLISQSCLTFCDPRDCSPPGSSVHRTLQVRILQCVAIPFSRGSSQPRNQTWVSHNAGRFFTVWATRGATESSTRVCKRDCWLHPPGHLILLVFTGWSLWICSFRRRRMLHVWGPHFRNTDLNSLQVNRTHLWS